MSTGPPLRRSIPPPAADVPHCSIRWSACVSLAAPAPQTRGPPLPSNRCQWALAARPPSTLRTTATVTSFMVSPANAWVAVGQTVVADGIAVTAQQLIGKWDKTQPRRLRGIASCIDWKALMYRQFRRMLLAE